MEDNWAMKKVERKWNDLYSSAKPGSVGKQWWENGHNSFVFCASSQMVILLGSFYRSAGVAFYLCDGGCLFVYMCVVKEWFWLFVFLLMCLLTSQPLAALGFVLFRGSKIVFSRSWCLCGQKAFSAGKRQEKVVLCGMMLGRMKSLLSSS